MTRAERWQQRGYALLCAAMTWATASCGDATLRSGNPAALSQSAISNTQPSTYVWATLGDGESVFIDRGYTYRSVPTELAGLLYLRTANDDKLSTAGVSFDVDRPVKVYVAFDPRITNPPAWLSAFAPTGLTLSSTDVPRDVYEKSFPAGAIVLGGNAGIRNSSMYSVIVADDSTNPPPPPPPSGTLEITNTSPGTYVWEPLAVGGTVYVDRSYRYTTVPAELDGAAHLRTANDDKGTMGASLVTFDVNQNVQVYVAHDDRYTTKPAWLNSFTLTSIVLKSTDVPRSVWVKRFAAGQVSLGGNTANANQRFSMYSVVVVPEGGTPTPTPDAAPAPTRHHLGLELARLARAVQRQLAHHLGTERQPVHVVGRRPRLHQPRLGLGPGRHHRRLQQLQRR